MNSSRPWRQHLLALCGYAAFAVIFTWPLAPQLGTHLTGSPAGDTGVYVWNQWVFHHEVLKEGNFPYFTSRIFSLTGPANLSLHNYTAFQDLLALPLLGWLGVVATFNVVFLLMTVLTGYGAFLLAKHVTGHNLESWLAGLLFAWSPVLATRGGAHFSLVAAAPLPIFLLVLLRAAERQRLRDAVALGAVVCWAATTDAYYAVYCVILSVLFTLAHVIRLQRLPARPRSRAVPWTLDVLLFCVAGLVLSMIISGGWQFTIRGRVAGVRSLYTPMLLLTLLACLRVAWAHRGTMFQVDRSAFLRFARLGAVGAMVAAVLLSPVLYAVGVRFADGRWDSEPIYWRSSPQGIDLAAYVLPNPNHPLVPQAVRQWLTPRPDAYFENVASLTFVALLTILGAWRAGWRIPRLWARPRARFGVMALGPFVHVAAAEYIHPRAVGCPPLPPGHRSCADARSVCDRVDAGPGGVICRRAVLAGQPVAKTPHPTRHHRRRTARVRIAARATPALFSGDPNRLPARGRGARRHTGARLAVGGPGRHHERRELHRAVSVLPDSAWQEAHWRISVSGLETPSAGHSSRPNDGRPHLARRRARARPLAVGGARRRRTGICRASQDRLMS